MPNATEEEIYLYDYITASGWSSPGYLNRTEILIEGIQNETITLIIKDAQFPYDDGSYGCSVQPLVGPAEWSNLVPVGVNGE